MRIVKVIPRWLERVKDMMSYEVAYKMRGRGNNLYYTAVMAQDEMEAYKMVRNSILYNEEQTGIENVRNFEMLNAKFPNSGYKKELSKARRILKQIRNEINGNEP